VKLFDILQVKNASVKSAYCATDYIRCYLVECHIGK